METPSSPGQWLIAKTNSFWVVFADGVNTPKGVSDSISKRQHKSFQILLFILQTFPTIYKRKGALCVLGGNGRECKADKFCAHRPIYRFRLLILMCAAHLGFISNNDNHSATRKTQAHPKIENVEHVFKKEKKKQKLFANVRIFCPTKKKTY
jgi:hypothetical protein